MSDEEMVSAEGVVESQDTGEAAVDSGIEQAAPEAAAPEQPAPWETFKGLPQFQGLDDQQIAAHLYQTMQREQAQARALQQYQQLVPVASEYLSNRQQYQQWRAAQQAAQQAPQPQQAAAPKSDNWWNPPQIKDSFKQYLTRDADGREVIAEHAPLEAKAALQDWMSYRADFAKKFLDNPEQTLGPMVQSIAERQAAEIVERQLSQQRREQFVKSVEAENAEWLYQNPETRMASREGLQVQKYIEDVKSMGVSDPEHRWQLSVAMLERDLALQVLQQFVGQQQQAETSRQASQPVPPPVNPAAEQAQKNMEYLRSQAQRTATRSSPATTDSRVPKRPLTFADKLRANLQADPTGNLE